MKFLAMHYSDERLKATNEENTDFNFPFDFMDM